MLLSYASRSVTLAQRARSRIERTGQAPGGKQVWSEAEDKKLLATKGEELGAIVYLFPGRTEFAIRSRRLKLGLRGRRVTKPWSVEEDKILRRNAATMNWWQISTMLPGRSRAAVQGRARHLGVCSVWRWDGPKPYNIPLYDAIRRRSWEDGIGLKALDRELKTGDYFHKNGFRKRNPQGHLNIGHIRKAVEFFGGELTIDWKDV
jgi:hypothetical protein